MHSGRARSRNPTIWRGRGAAVRFVRLFRVPCCLIRCPRTKSGRAVRAVVHLSDGRAVTADEAYLRDSILLPKRDVVAGFEPIMPSFAGVVDEDDMQRLVAYLMSLRTKPSAAAGEKP